jgi:DNA-binding transcriptional LysR family regulator
MELLNKDLNLLNVFSVIWEERNLSKAAERLYLSQSAVSHALKRLRADFEDPLFVRESKGVAPTDLAISLAPRIRQALQGLEGLYTANRAFVPKEAERTLVLAAGDYFSVTMLERFVARLAVEAPKVKLIIKPVANIFQLDRFENGEVHLAITAIDVKSKEGFRVKEVRKERISFCARKKHPLVTGKLSPEKYLKMKHLNVSNFGSDQGVVDEYLDTIGKKREVVLVASSFFDAGRLVRSTDMLLSAPESICESLADDYDLAVYPFPFQYPLRNISMVWHERTEQDPFHAWVRELLLRGER